MQAEDCQDCSDLRCWLAAVCRHPLLVFPFARWLSDHDMPAVGELLRRTRLPQAVSFCECWKVQLDG